MSDDRMNIRIVFEKKIQRLKKREKKGLGMEKKSGWGGPRGGR